LASDSTYREIIKDVADTHFSVFSVHEHLAFFTSCLLDILLTSGLASQYPLRLAMHISLVLNSDAAEMSEDVLHLSISVAASGTAEVIDGRHAGKNVVDHSNDDDTANRVTPYYDHGDDRGVAAVLVASELIDRVSEKFVWGAAEPSCDALATNSSIWKG
jgi:hypothetical protein